MMRLGLAAVGLSGLVALAGCVYYPNPPAWNQAALEQPQPVHFCYGYVIDRRDVPIDYAMLPGTIPRWRIQAFSAQRSPVYGGLAEGQSYLPNLPAVEYSVMLDKGTAPPDTDLDRGQRASIIVVQNEQFGSENIRKGDRAFVRIVGNPAIGYSGRVIRADTLENVHHLRIEDYVSCRAIPIRLDLVAPPPPPPPPPFAPTVRVRTIDP